MRTNISSDQGLVTTSSGTGVLLEGLTPEDAAWDNGRWDDLQGDVHGQTGTGKADLTYEAYRDTDFNLYFFQHNQDDQINVVYQLPHMWDSSTSVYPHMHLVAAASASVPRIVRFEFTHVWVPYGSVMPASASWTTTYTSYAVSGSMQYVHRRADFGPIAPPVSASASTMLFVKVRRLGFSDAADTYTESKPDGTAAANLGVLYCDLHYQKNRAGTTVPYP